MQYCSLQQWTFLSCFAEVKSVCCFIWKNAPQGLEHLNTWSPGDGTIWGCLGGALLEGVHHWGWALKTACSFLPLPHAYVRRLSASCSHLTHVVYCHASPPRWALSFLYSHNSEWKTLSSMSYFGHGILATEKTIPAISRDSQIHFWYVGYDYFQYQVLSLFVERALLFQLRTVFHVVSILQSRPDSRLVCIHCLHKPLAKGSCYITAMLCSFFSQPR